MYIRCFGEEQEMSEHKISVETLQKICNMWTYNVGRDAFVCFHGFGIVLDDETPNEAAILWETLKQEHDLGAEGR